MNILVMCEESQEVCKAFRKKGVNSFSCDILPCSGGYPEYHIKDDGLKIASSNTFKTMDDKVHIINKWDMIIAFPPCTHLAVSGARWFNKKRDTGVQYEAVKFFADIYNLPCDKIAIENPVNIIGSDYIKQWFKDFSYIPGPTQYIQPYEYGEPFRKKTGLWLKGLTQLKPTNIVEPNLVQYTRSDGRVTTFSADYGFCKNGGLRSKTYPGIAEAMASQWL